jgi:UDP-glucose 4-epimerase
LTQAIKECLRVPDHDVQVIGTRHGEKLYEALLSREEMAAAEDLGDYYRVPPDLRSLNYDKFVEQGEVKISESVDYNSHNTRRLDRAEMVSMLKSLPFMQARMSGRVVEAVD